MFYRVFFFLFFIFYSIFTTAQSKAVSTYLPINYQALLQDSVLEMTIACGYTEEAKQIAADLLQPIYKMNFMDCRAFVNKRKLKGIEKQEKLGYEIYEGKTTIKYPDENGTMQTQNSKLRVTIILPGLQAKEKFLEKLETEEIVVYMGHGRRGIGPDFDAIKSSERNIVFGLNSDLHKQNKLKMPGDASYKVVSIPLQNDIEKINQQNNWKELPYRLWFFNACNTKYYMDEFREGLIPKSVSDNTDLLLTNGLVALYAGGSTCLTFLDALLDGKMDKDLTEEIFQSQQKCLTQSGFYFEKHIQEYKPAYFYHQAKTPVPYFPTVKDEHATPTVIKKTNSGKKVTN